jgi:hypothetical protein
MALSKETRYIRNLSEAVLPLSLSQGFKEACTEWTIDSYYYTNFGETCICGKEKIKHVYSIYNEVTDEILKPIGSKCIHKFDNSCLRIIVRVLEHHSKDEFKYGKYANNPKTLEYIYENDYNWILWTKNNRTRSKYMRANNAFNKLFKYTEIRDKKMKQK